jgi:hypothetical protein
MISFAYNTELFISLVVAYFAWAGVSVIGNGMLHDGEPATHSLNDIFGGLVLIAIAIIPVFV